MDSFWKSPEPELLAWRIVLLSVRAANRSPLGAIFSAVEMMSQMAETPEALANNLAFLQIDLTDPDFHRLAVEHSRATEDGYRALLEEAVAAGELVRCDTARLARVIGALEGGSMLSVGDPARRLRGQVASAGSGNGVEAVARCESGAVAARHRGSH